MINKDIDSQERKYEFISKQHGGYWRHDFVDHAYLYNLYFPPESFFEKLKDKIHELVLNYPLAQDALASLVGDLIGQPAERIVVGNGAAELIKIVSGHIAQKLIIPVPSFNEYANAVPDGNVIEFPLEPDTFELDVDKFADEIIRTKADIAVVVTPNNPTSLLVPKADLIRLLNKIKDCDCMLIVDESFIDFANDRDKQTLDTEIELHPNLTVFKSMSKAYGICGLRVGYMLTANSEFAAKVRDGIHIWNINGFAETFLELAPQYRKDFSDSCEQVKSDRDKFYEELKSIKGLIVFKPDANYIFCRLPNHSATGPEVTKRLFVEHNIYIKHCKGKTMPESDRYLRIASRTQAENNRLVENLRDIIGVEAR